MTREEIINEIKSILEELNYPDAVSYLTQNDREWLEENIRVLEQEPRENEYIKVPKKALKYRTAGMVAYNAEWLNIERAVICGAQQPCDDAISRRTVINLIRGCNNALEEPRVFDTHNSGIIFEHYIIELPSVTPQPKTGHWIEGKYRDDDIRYNDSSYKCDKCGRIVDFKENYCPDCGFRMVESQESEG